VKDVDFLVRVDGDPKSDTLDAKDVIRSLKRALDGLPEALGYEGYTGIELERARRSVHVYFSSEDFHLDVVPCVAPNGFDDPIWVPDWGTNAWVKSHPLGVVELIQDMDQQYNSKFRRLIRVFKHFRNYQMKTRKPKSYWLVAMVIEAVRNDKVDMDEPLAVVFRDLLDHLYSKYAPLLGRHDEPTPNIQDPMLGHNISWNWEWTHFKTFMSRLDDGRGWAHRALQSGDRAVAIELWQRIFGADYFPASIEDHARLLAAARQPGQTAASPTGLILPGAASGVRSTAVSPRRRGTSSYS
jgi:hypothetical protein